MDDTGGAQLESDEASFAICHQERGPLQVQAPTTELLDVSSWPDGVLVVCGGQFGPYQVSAKTSPGEPPIELDPYSDVIEFSVTATEPVIATELVDAHPSVVLCSTPGNYRIRLCVTGRQAGYDSQWENATTTKRPVERYLFQTWSAPLSPGRVLKSTPLIEAPRRTGRLPETGAGEQGAWDIGQDVLGRGRKLSGAQGSIKVTSTFPGTRRRRFNMFDRPWSRTGTWDSMGVGGLTVGVATSVSTGEYSNDHLTGLDRSIEHEYLIIDSPRTITSAWRWVDKRFPPTSDGRPVGLVADTLVQSRYTQRRSHQGDPETLIQIKHSQLPVEWLDDMRGWWTWQFALANE